MTDGKQGFIDHGEELHEFILSVIRSHRKVLSKGLLSLRGGSNRSGRTGLHGQQWTLRASAILEGPGTQQWHPKRWELRSEPRYIGRASAAPAGGLDMGDGDEENGEFQISGPNGWGSIY